MTDKIQTDLFDEPHVTLDKNPTLEKAVNHLLILLQRNPDLLNGESVKEINGKVVAEFWLDEGLRTILIDHTNDRIEAFKKFMQTCTGSDVIERALRQIVNTMDLYRLPAKVIQKAERDRVRISRSFKKH
jgi:hypothetical protein